MLDSVQSLAINMSIIIICVTFFLNVLVFSFQLGFFSIEFSMFVDKTSFQHLPRCLVHTSSTLNGRRTPWRRFGRISRKETVAPPSLDFPEALKIGLVPEEMCVQEN